MERLKEIMVEKAVLQFDLKEIPIEEFETFLDATLFIPDWDKNFVKEVYSLYLKKINKAGEDLTIKVNAAAEPTAE